MLKCIDKLFNKLGYYQFVSSKYYKVQEDEVTKIVPNSKVGSKFDEDAVKDATKLLLYGLGEDINRPGLKETPRRVAGYWRELTEGTFMTNEQIAGKFKKDFEVGYDPIVFKECDKVFSHCEHHLALMFNGTVYVCYIPTYYNGKNDKDGYRVIGLSKIPRIVDMCAKRLQLQEKLASDIAECISSATGSDQVYVEIIMDHGCVSARGVKSSGVTRTPYMTPKLKQNNQARLEIQNMVNTAILNKR